MRSSLSKFVGLSVALAAIAGGTRSPGGTIHATAQVNTGSSSDDQTGMTTASAYAEFSFPGPPPTSGYGSAFATGSPGVFVTASASSNDFNTQVQAQALWNDRVFLSGPAAALPDDLDFFFTSSGTVADLGVASAAYLDVGASSSSPGGTSFGGRYYHDGRGIGVETTPGGGTWDTITYDDSTYLGTFHIRVGLESDGAGGLQGDWSLVYAAALLREGLINGNDPPTFSFDAVRLADGRTVEEAGFSLRFDSGILSPNISAVPEPSTLALAGLGSIGLLGYGWNRRRRTAA